MRERFERTKKLTILLDSRLVEGIKAYALVAQELKRIKCKVCKAVIKCNKYLKSVGLDQIQNVFEHRAGICFR